MLLLLAACAHTVPPPSPDLPPATFEAAARMAGTVQAVSDRPLNLGRLDEVKERAAEIGVVHVEPIDAFSLQRNVWVELPGASPELAYVVAHYDKTDVNPLKVASLLVNGALDEPIGLTFASEGAIDNASGVAVALELGRALAARDRYYTWRVLLVGSEESGLRGSRAHVARIGKADRDRIVVAVNLDSVGADFSGNCVHLNVSDRAWSERLMRVAEAAGAPLGAGFMPPGAMSDYAPFARTSPLLDIGRGTLFSLAGGLLPQRSWFTTFHSAPAISVGACELLDIGDIVGSAVLLPIGRIHGPRDHAGRVDPARLVEAWAAVTALIDDMERRPAPDPDARP